MSKFIAGMIFIVLILFVIGGIATAGPDYGPKQCPPGQRGDCSTYVQQTTLREGCFPNNANLGQGWIFKHKGCGDSNKSKDPTATATLAPVVTEKPIIPSQTAIPDIENKGGKSSSTTEIIYVDSVEKLLACPEDCICMLLESVVTQMSISNKIALTQIAVDKERNEILLGD